MEAKEKEEPCGENGALDAEYPTKEDFESVVEGLACALRTCGGVP